MRSLIFSSLLCLLLVQAALSLKEKTDCKCRIQASKRIVGGRQADAAAYPWQVSLMLKENIPVPKLLRKLVPAEVKIAKHFCGGTILNEQTILTAAHCIPDKDLDGVDISEVRIGLGDNNLVKIYDDEMYAEIESAIVPDGWFPSLQTTEDIALIKLKKPLQFSKTIQPACLPTEEQDVYEGALKTCGWGANNPLTIHRYTGKPEEKRIVTRYLKEAEVYDQSSTLELCKRKKYASDKEVQNTLCTINAKTNETACQGDSGGPLHYLKDGRAFVVGVTKEGLMEEIEGNRYRVCTGQTAYTPVIKTMDFIKRHVGDNYCS